ncbi:MAG: SRPBCC domain-containing protein [bacterium]|nr:SRPBCC domain-containing protein [bacterium]
MTATPAQVFRALTSQNELRKWFAPRVIMSRNLVSQEQDRSSEMRLMQSDKYSLVRYSWREQDWDPEIETTTITYRIRDLGASRSRTGEGLLLEVSHDGWTDSVARDRQAAIWKKALNVLDKLLAGKPAKAWWENQGARGSFQQVRLAALKPLVEQIGPEKKGGRKTTARALWKICSSVDADGNWYLKDDEQEFEFRCQAVRVFGLDLSGKITIYWSEMSKALGPNLEDFAHRLAVEQDMDVEVKKARETIMVQSISVELFIRWCQDILQPLQGSA